MPLNSAQLAPYKCSPLTDYVCISPNKTSPRTQPVWILTPHCVVGQCTIESLGNVFKPVARQASSNYGVDKDGRIGLFCDERDRSWCSSSSWNDHRGITIEVASDTTSPWAFRQAAWDGLVKLAVDICQRYGKTRLLWLGSLSAVQAYESKRASTDMVLTAHRWYASTACVPVETEVLTRRGWKQMGRVEIGDEIACATLDGLHISFEPVLDKVPEREQETYTCNGLTATGDHRVVFSTGERRDYCCMDTLESLLAGGKQVRIPLAGQSKFKGIPMEDNLLSLLVAVQAGGRYLYELDDFGQEGYRGVEFHYQKRAQVDRLKELMTTLELVYEAVQKPDGTERIRIYNEDDWNVVEAVCEAWLSDRQFTWDWLYLSPDQARLFLKEILFWNGSEDGRTCQITSPRNRDIINAIAAVNGVGSQATETGVVLEQEPYLTLCNGDADLSKMETRKERVTCVTVQTGIILCRQHGRTFVIGNCPGDWFYAREAQFANEVTAKLSGTTVTPTPSAGPLYRVRKSWEDAQTQLGAYSSLENAKAAADSAPGYSVYNEEGVKLYPFTQYTAKTTAKAGLNVRKTPVSGAVVTVYPYGTLVTILSEENGWGYTDKGWISLQYVQKVETSTPATPPVQDPPAQTTPDPQPADPGLSNEPGGELTYDQFKALMNRYRLELQSNEAGSWSKEARDWAIRSGLIQGANTFADGTPNYMYGDWTTREALVTVLYRFAQQHGLV